MSGRTQAQPKVATASSRREAVWHPAQMRPFAAPITGVPPQEAERPDLVGAYLQRRRIASSLGGLTSPGEEAVAGPAVQRAPAGSAPSAEARSPAAENRTGMPDRLKTGLEQLSGHDLSAINVHYNSAKPAQLNAHAYTQGTDIHVAPGQQKHLPHEGWHAVQQMQGRVKPTMQAHGVSINDDRGLENEADVMGRRANTVQRRTARRGHDFGRLAAPTTAANVHYNSAKPAQLNALAYAQGTDIHVDLGQEKHLPHEGWHAAAEASSPVQREIVVKDPEGDVIEGLGTLAMEVRGAVFDKIESVEGNDPDDFNGVWGNYLENLGVLESYLAKLCESDTDGTFDLSETADVIRLYNLLKGLLLEDLHSETVPVEEIVGKSSTDTLGDHAADAQVAVEGLSEMRGKAKDVGDAELSVADKAKVALAWWNEKINENTRTTPEAGYPALLTAYQDAASKFKDIDAQVEGEGAELKAEAMKASKDSSSLGDPSWANAATHASGIADSLALFADSYKTISALQELGKAETASEKHHAKSAAKSGAAGAGIAALNAAKYLAVMGGTAVGGAVLGGVASLALYCQVLYQMLEAEGQYLDLTDIKIVEEEYQEVELGDIEAGGHKRLTELLKYLKGKKFRRFVKKGIATAGAAVAAGLSAGAIAAMAIGGAAAVAALAVTPVGLALGGIALTIGLGLAAYKIYRKAKQSKEGRGDERRDWADYLHEKVNATTGILPTDAKYKKRICTQIIRALGLEPADCEGPKGKENIYEALES